jgi:hypothetical protein
MVEIVSVSEASYAMTVFQSSHYLAFEDSPKESQGLAPPPEELTAATRYGALKDL